MHAEHTVTLAFGMHAPAHARAWLTARTPDTPGDARDDALLMVSELVTNAVRHGEPDIVLSLHLKPRMLRIEVHDCGGRFPIVPGERPALDRSTGRGLLIVAATASDWGVLRSSDGPGKTVWAELALPPV